MTPLIDRAADRARDLRAAFGAVRVAARRYQQPSAGSTPSTLDSPCAWSTTHDPTVGSDPRNRPDQQMESRSRLSPYELPASVTSRRQTSTRSSSWRTDVTSPRARAMAGLHAVRSVAASTAPTTAPHRLSTSPDSMIRSMSPRVDPARLFRRVVWDQLRGERHHEHQRGPRHHESHQQHLPRRGSRCASRARRSPGARARCSAPATGWPDGPRRDRAGRPSARRCDVLGPVEGVLETRVQERVHLLDVGDVIELERVVGR